MHKNWQDLKRFARFVATRFAQERCTQIAASLTFTTLLAIVPLIAIALTMISALPWFDDLTNEVKTFLLSNLMPDKAGKLIARYMQQFTGSAMHLTSIGLAVLGAIAVMMMMTIEQSFNIIWRTKRKRSLLKRLVMFSSVLAVAPVLLGLSLTLTSWLVGLSLGYAKQIPFFGVGMLKILPVMFTTLAFALLYRLVPNRYVPIRHALIGAICAAILFETMSRVFGYYVSHVPTYKLVYGAFASVPIFLMWIYASWLTILVGAVITASMPHWRTPPSPHLPPVVLMLDALRLLKIMASVPRAVSLTVPELSKRLHIGYEPIEEILNRLESVHIVEKADGRGWLLYLDPDKIRATELLHLFVLNRSSLFSEQDADPLQRWLAECAAQLENSTDITLQQLFAGKANQG